MGLGSPALRATADPFRLLGPGWDRNRTYGANMTYGTYGESGVHGRAPFLLRGNGAAGFFDFLAGGGADFIDGDGELL